MNISNPATAAQPGNDPARPSGMPLGARRLLLLGGLSIPIGLVAGPYLFGIQLLSVAGVVAVSVALSYQIGRPWFRLWPRLTAAAGAAWTAATISYWVTVVTAADSSAPAPDASPTVFNIGVAAFVAMALIVLAGTVARFRSRRRLS